MDLSHVVVGLPSADLRGQRCQASGLRQGCSCAQIRVHRRCWAWSMEAAMSAHDARNFQDCHNVACALFASQACLSARAVPVKTRLPQHKCSLSSRHQASPVHVRQ